MPARLSVRAVPGAACDEIVGRLDDRLKVRISAPPEGGRANEAIGRFIAEALGLRPRNLQIVSGHSRTEKMVEIEGARPGKVHRRLLGP